MGRFYVDSRNDVTLRFPNDTIAYRKKKKKKTLGTGDHHTAHAGAGNQFRAAAVASEDRGDVHVIKDRKTSTMNRLIKLLFFLFTEIF